MSVPVRTYSTSPLRQLCRLTVLILLSAAPLFARGPGPALRIPLDSLGFQTQSTQFLLTGSSMMTLHYVDNLHLLFTFKVHRLMKRIANDPPDDEDRTVEAVLVELPSGRVLARTNWRFHDNGQYLWGLGQGRFMLRVRDTLTTFAPLANLASGQPFLERAFLTTDRRIGAMLLSPEADLLIVESVERKAPVARPATPLFGPTTKPEPTPLGEPGEPNPVALNFYRLSMPGASGDDVRMKVAGVAHSANFGDVAATAAGHLRVVNEGRQQWAFDFSPFHGDTKELAPFGSTCNPSLRFVSSSEFVAFGCHLGNRPQVLGGFNMRGEEMWEQTLPGDYVAQSMVFAASSGRFALGRVLGESSADDLQPVLESALTSQSVVVYQTESGKQILRVDCTPIARAGQNFALSPDGLSLAVVRGYAIELYGLPQLSTKELADIKEARRLVPQTSELPIEFAGPSPVQAISPPESDSASAKAASADSIALPEVPKAASVPVAAPAPAAVQPAVSRTAVGDAAPEQRRKPPTLYTLPGDKGGGGAEEETK